MLKLALEIKSKSGVVVFRRYHLFSTPWFRCYLHRIFQADQDHHSHNHPWSFLGIILWGGYVERYTTVPVGADPLTLKTDFRGRGLGSVLWGGGTYFHKIESMLRPTTSLFFTGIKTHEWGYMTLSGFVTEKAYRELKQRNELKWFGTV
jgi:hypothetical protein